MKIYVPGDSAAKAVGADEVAAAVAREAAARGLNVEVIRNGTRGMIWLEPLLEVERAEGRSGFGPVTAADVPALFDAGFGAFDFFGPKPGIRCHQRGLSASAFCRLLSMAGTRSLTTGGSAFGSALGSGFSDLGLPLKRPLMARPVLRVKPPT